MPKRRFPKFPQTIDLQIDTLDVSGLGIAQWSDKSVVVHGAFPGEQVRVRIDGGGQHRFHGMAISILVPSVHRIEPRCAVVDRCGGCPLQRLDPDTQREIKVQHLTETLGFADNLHDILRPIRAVADSYGYRNKGLWMTGATDVAVSQPSTGVSLGLFRPWTHELVPLTQCPVQDDPTHTVLKQLPEILSAHKITNQWLRAVLARSNGTHTLVTLVGYPQHRPRSLVNLATSILSIPTVIGVAENETPPSSNAVVGPVTHMLAGADRLEYTLGSVRFFAGPTSFVQTNAAGAHDLIQVVRSLLPGPYVSLMDLYSGVGMFALAMADRVSTIIAVEASKDAASWARHNFSLYSGNTVLESVCNDVGQFISHAKPVDVVIVDPPRAGCGAPVISSICEQLRPAVVVYISCHPASFAQDAQRLVAHGYTLTDVVPIDMFPHTPHVELVAKLVRTTEWVKNTHDND